MINFYKVFKKCRYYKYLVNVLCCLGSFVEDINLLYSRQLTGSYFAGAPGECQLRSFYHLVRPIAPTRRPRCNRHADDLIEPPMDKAVASKMYPRPLASHQDVPRFSLQEHLRFLVCELHFYVNFVSVQFVRHITYVCYGHLKSIYIICMLYWFIVPREKQITPACEILRI